MDHFYKQRDYLIQTNVVKYKVFFTFSHAWSYRCTCEYDKMLLSIIIFVRKRTNRLLRCAYVSYYIRDVSLF